jgi:16S rRNA (cytosine967-C5)-methyltransferase
MSTDSRRAALELLEAVRTEDAYANVVWPRMLDRWSLSGRDAAFATDLAYGTLRMRGLYDAVIDACSTRSTGEIDPQLLDILRLGTHQILGMRVPDHAAVDSSCGLARVQGFTDTGRVGFVNAVLRKVARHDIEQWQRICTEQLSEDAALAVATSHPEWIVRAVREAWAGHRQQPATEDELAAVLAADNIPAKPTIALRGQFDDSDLEGTAPARWIPRARVLDTVIPNRSELLRDARAIVQDEGSQLAVQALLAAAVDPPESAWLDMCAGPGGKAALLADAAQREQVGLLAVELHAHRADLVRSAVGAHVPIEIEVADATARPWGNRFFDRILLDAPCTGLGALRRRPEARWRRRPSDVRELTGLQHALLDTAVDSLRRGGVLAYVTCSPHLAETRGVIDDALMTREDIIEEDAMALLPAVPDVGPGPHVQLWPHLHGTDAMFIAILRRR